MKKNRLLIFLLAFVVSMAFVGSQAEAKTKVKKIQIRVGEHKTLPQWDKKSDWKQKGKSYVKVSAKGKITGLKKGVSTISVKTGKNKIKYKVVVKNAYYQFDFRNVSKITVRDLNSGKLSECNEEQCDSLKKMFLNHKFRRLAGNTFSKKVGAYQYGICMYDANGKNVYNFSVNSRYIRFHGGKTYRAGKKILLSNLF